MERVLIMVALGGLTLALVPAASAQTTPAASVRPESTPGTPSDIPPMPRGKTTILGGGIREVDPVRDRFSLNIYGMKPLRVLFDERTKVFRDGKPIPLHDLAACDHASVETTLDGADVFAVTVHILSQNPEGDYQGTVMAYDGETGMLMLSAAPGRPPFRVRVTSSTTFERVGQSAFSSAPGGVSDLVRGSLIKVRFDTDNRGQGVASRISVMAAPGAAFVFSGELTALNMAAGSLTLMDPRDNRSYQISFDPYAQVSRDLRVGQHMRIAADFDGTRYFATEMTIQ